MLDEREMEGNCETQEKEDIYIGKIRKSCEQSRNEVAKETRTRRAEKIERRA